MNAQQPRDAKGFFFGLLFLIVAAIAATVLLANDGRNLNLLLSRYGLRAPETDPADAPGQRTAKRPAADERGARLSPRAQPPGILRPSSPAPAAICEFLARQGFDSGEWKPSYADRNALECTAERIFAGPQEAAAAQGSLFVVIRGRQDDDVSALRVKLVAPEGESGAAARKALDELLAALADMTGWSALRDIGGPVSRLEDATVARVDMAVAFKREISNPDAYNLIVSPLEADVRKFQAESRSGR